jgi:RNA-directed DNA polymerase
MLQRLLDLIFSRGHDVNELARRLDLPKQRILDTPRDYNEFQVRKRSGKNRQISAPNRELKQLQRRILRRLLARLKTHPQATGFQPGVSFVDNAQCHQSQAVVIKVDLVDFFPSIQRNKVQAYFRFIGWNRKAARLLTDLTTYRGMLPQGAPTSPRLSNLVNYLLDTQLVALSNRYDGVYTRYADDITISLGEGDWDVHTLVAHLMRTIRRHGYEPHIGRKFDIRRLHQRQVVTGLVVNDRANLPRETRRWLRAVEHRAKAYTAGGSFCRPPTLTEEQLQGWRSLRKMIERNWV